MMTTKHKTFRGILFLVCMAALLTACHDSIFEMVDDEVELEGGLAGNAATIISDGTYLYMTCGHEGKLYYKKASDSYNGAWSSFSVPGRPIFLTTDNDGGTGTMKFLSVGGFVEDEDEGTNVPSGFDEYQLYGPNKYKSEPIGHHNYAQDGSTIPSDYKKMNLTTRSGTYTVGTSGTALSYDIYQGGTKIYTSNWYIHAISETADYILIGTVDGLARISKSSHAAVAFEDNARTSLNKDITMIYVRDPSKNLADTDVYVCLSPFTTYLKQGGLWAYYPERGYWNQDGD